jgi:hypothetical protein
MWQFCDNPLFPNVRHRPVRDRRRSLNGRKSVVVKQKFRNDFHTQKTGSNNFHANVRAVSQPFWRMQAARITGRPLGFW